MLSPESTYQFTPTCASQAQRPVLNGSQWQVSGGHGRIDPAAAIAEMLRYHDAGFRMARWVQD